MKLIVLAAGDAFELDGFNKLLVKHPVSRKTIIEQYADFFDPEQIEIVVGYRAMEVMNEFPMFRYHYNRKWQTTGNSYSLALALDATPCVVISCDFFIDAAVFEHLAAFPDCALIRRTENRLPNSVNAVVDEDCRLAQIYRGKCNDLDPELPGVFKVSDQRVLTEWKRRCLAQPRLFAAENLPCDLAPVQAVPVAPGELTEINFPEDFIELAEELRYA